MWIAIWLLISAFIVGVAVWSLQILGQQKRAWSAYAKKHNFDYDAGRLMESPRITAHIEHMQINLYTDVQRVDDVRTERYVTVIEIALGEGMPTGAVIATPEWRAFAESLSFDMIYTPDAPDWKGAYIIKTRNKYRLAVYLTPERIETLLKLFAMKNSMTLYFFDEQEAALRIETVRRLVEHAKILKMGAAERAAFKEKVEALMDRDAFDKTVLPDEPVPNAPAKTPPEEKS